MKEILANQQEAKQAQEGAQIVQGVLQEIEIKYDLTLSIDSKEQFDDFNYKLMNEEEFRKDFVSD